MIDPRYEPQQPVEAPEVPGEEGVELEDAGEQLARSPEEKTNRTEREPGTTTSTDVPD